MIRLLPVFLIATLLASPASALTLPGQSTTPQAAGAQNLLLRTDERRRLVYINNVKVSNVEAFTSNSGKKHLRFRLTANGATYGGIIFAGDWTPADQTLLQRRTAHLLGVWGEFDGQPSFTAMRVFGSPIVPNAKAPREQTVQIRDVQVLTPTVAPYRSAAGKQHLTFSFVVNSKTYQAVAYDGDWTADTARLLRAGRATLYGSWAEYRGKPSFVVNRVAR